MRGSARVTSADPEASYQALEKYSTDLTARAREGKLDRSSVVTTRSAASSRC